MPTPVPADQVVLSTSHTNKDGRPYSFADGHAGSDVTAATLQLTDGSAVRATIAHGWFVAWWPGNRAVTAVQITTPTGTHTQRLGTPPAPPPGAGKNGSLGTSSFSTGGPGRSRSSVIHSWGIDSSRP